MASQSTNLSSGGVATLQTVEQTHMRSKGLLQKAIYRILHDPLTLGAIVVMVLITGACFAAPLIVEYVLRIEYNRSDPRNSYAEPFAQIVDRNGITRTYVLGTDDLGRDLASRLLYGGQISLKIGFFAAIGSLTIGVLIGVVSGYFGGVIDDLIVWMITTLNSVPTLYLLLTISAVLRPDENSLIMVLIFLGWTGTARIMRGEAIALRDREYVVAARALGASSFRVMFIHIAPNVISLLLIVLSSSIGGLILAESALSFLQFGVQPPTPTWGNMLSGSLSVLRESPHVVIAPGVLITTTVLCLYIIGDGLRDAFDPRLAD